MSATACNHKQPLREYLFLHIDLKLPGSRQLLSRHLSQVHAPTAGWCLDILLEAKVTCYSSITHLVDFCIYYSFIYDTNWCNAVLCMCECSFFFFHHSMMCTIMPLWETRCNNIILIIINGKKVPSLLKAYCTSKLHHCVLLLKIRLIHKVSPYVKNKNQLISHVSYSVVILR